jgi:hypothetical protein
MKINLSIEMLQKRSIPQLLALLDTGDDWLKPQTLEAVRQLLISKQQGA